MPGTTLQQAAELVDHPKIISNTNKIQAIETRDELQAVFYEPGALQSENYGEIQVDKPRITSYNVCYTKLLRAKYLLRAY